MTRLSIIDDHGRLFGRVNLIDAGLVAFVALLVPLGYTAFQLLRTPAPQVLSIDPPTLTPGKDLRVGITGTDLRPFLRARVGGKEASLLVESPTSAELKLPELEAGSYELVLYDAAQEVARRSQAVVIVSPPPPLAPPLPPTMALDVLGAFSGLDHATAVSLAKSQKLGDEGQAGSGEILYVQAPEAEVLRLREMPFLGRRQNDRFRVVALLRLRCGFVDGICSVGATPVAPGAVLTIALQNATVQFQVAGLFPTSTEFLTEVTVTGAFVGLEATRANEVAEMSPLALSPLESWGRALSLGRSEPEVVRLLGRRSESVGAGTTGTYKVNAALAVRCAIVGNQCKVGSAAVAPDAKLPILTRRGILTFEVAELYPAQTGSLAELKLSGVFVGLDAARAASLSKSSPSDTTEFWGSILSLGPSEPAGAEAAGQFKVSALLTIRCLVLGSECRLGGTAVTPRARLSIPTRQGIHTFEVAELYPSDVVSRAELRLGGAFIGLDSTRAVSLSKIRSSDQFLPEIWGGILSLGRSEPEAVQLPGRSEPIGAGTTGSYRVGAVLALRCAVIDRECKIGSTAVAPSARLSIPTRQGILTFEVTDIYSADVGTRAELKLNGAFVGLDATQVSSLSLAQSSGQSAAAEFWGGVLSLGQAEPEVVQIKGKSGLLDAGSTGKLRIPAVINVRCTIAGNDCWFGSTAVGPNTRLTIPTRQLMLTFEVRDVYPRNATLVTLTLRCATDPPLLKLLQQELAQKPVQLSELEPRLVAVRDIEDPVKIQSGSNSYGWEGRGVAFSLVVAVPAQKTQSGWQYEGSPLKAGARFTYTQPNYAVGGVITDVSAPEGS